ncbi:unnamed protein product [Parajaminaea phylloscopi]
MSMIHSPTSAMGDLSPHQAAGAPTRNFSRPSQYGSQSQTANGTGSRNGVFDASSQDSSISSPASSHSPLRDAYRNGLPGNSTGLPTQAHGPSTTYYDAEDAMASRLHAADPSDPKAGQSLAQKLRHAASASNLGRSLTKKMPARIADAETPQRSFARISSESRPSPRGVDDTDVHLPSQQETTRPLQTISPDTPYTGTVASPVGGQMQSRALHASEKDKGRKSRGIALWNSLFQNASTGRNQTTAFDPPLSAPANTTEFGVLRPLPPLPQSAVMARGASSASSSSNSKAERLLGINATDRVYKADRILGADESQRRAQIRLAENRLLKTQDLLAEFAIDWKPSHEPNFAPSRPLRVSKADKAQTSTSDSASSGRPSKTHTHNDSISSGDSFSTASTSETRVSTRAPQLDDNIGLPSRELSDDIDAILRSQRSSMQSVEDVLAAHRQIRKRGSSMSHHRKTSSTSSARSAMAAAAATHPLPGSSSRDEPFPGSVETQGGSPQSSLSHGHRTRHQTKLSASSEMSLASTTSSTRSRSTSMTSGSGRSLRWADQESSILDLPIPSLPSRANAGARTACRGASRDDAALRTSQKDKMASEPMDRVFSAPNHLQKAKVEPLLRNTERTAGSLSPHPFSFVSRPALRTTKSSGATPSISPTSSQSGSKGQQSDATNAHPARMRILQDHAIKTLSTLPPLSSLLDACIVASKGGVIDPWLNMSHRPLTASASSAHLPPSWPEYIKAYARGDFDISQPPKPVYTPHESSYESVHSRGETLSSAMHPSHVRVHSGDKFGPNIDDLAFPMPPTRPDGGGTPSQSVLGSPASLTQSLPHQPESHGLAHWAVSQKDSCPDQIPDQPNSALCEAPRPHFEDDRQSAVSQLMAALGLNMPHPRPLYHNATLSAIVARLGRVLSARDTSIQLISEDELITLAQSKASPEEDVDIMRTPRPEGNGQACSGALGVDLFAFDPQNSSGDAVRDATLQAHVILSRSGAPVIIRDVGADWRFSSRSDLTHTRFFAASSIMSASGLPVGVISVTDASPRPVGLNREEKYHLAEAAREASSELQRLQKLALVNRLSLLDESLWSWCREEHSDEPSSMTPLGRQVTPSSIETTLLAAPLPAATLSPPSPNSLAERRGAKAPQALVVSSPAKSAMGQQSGPSNLLRNALRIIGSALQMDLVYLARVTSNLNSDGDSVRCTIHARHDQTLPSDLYLDGPLHLCALAAAKRGLHIQQDPCRVGQLLGTTSAASQTDGCTDKPPYRTAALFSCGLIEGGKTWQGTDGWVLGVASKSPTLRLAAEDTIYLLRFAALLTSITLDGLLKESDTHLTATRSRGISSPGIAPYLQNRSRSASNARTGPLGPYNASPTSPVGSDVGSLRSASLGGRDSPLYATSPVASARSSRCFSPASRRAFPPPPLSPPPNEPLPALPNTPSPLAAARKLPSIGAVVRTPPTRPSPLPSPSPLTRQPLTAVSQPSNSEAVEYMAPTPELSQYDDADDDWPDDVDFSPKRPIHEGHPFAGYVSPRN